MIIHCMKKFTWEDRKEKEFWGNENLKAEGFIHCSTPELFWRIVPNFIGIDEELELVCIDSSTSWTPFRRRTPNPLPCG